MAETPMPAPAPACRLFAGDAVTVRSTTILTTAANDAMAEIHDRMPLILAPIHIAFLELIIDPACSIVFEAEPGNPDLMEQPPRSVREHLVSSRQLVLSLVQGCLVTLAASGFYFWCLSTGIATDGARALAFIVLIVANAVLIFPSRSPESGWRQMLAGLTPVVPWVLGGTLMGLKEKPR